AVQLGVSEGKRMVLPPPNGPFLFKQSPHVPPANLPVPGLVLSKAFHDTAGFFHPTGGKDLSGGMRVPIQDHACDLLDEAHPTWPGEGWGKGAQQGQPPCPQLRGWVHGTPPSSTSVFGFSTPNRMPWGES